MIQYMALDDLLLPNEEIRYRREIPNFKVSGEIYGELIVTDKRIIFYKQNGLIFKKDISETIGLSKVSGLKFKEKGRISKKGLIEIHGPIKHIIEGKLDDARYLYQTLAAKIE